MVIPRPGVRFIVATAFATIALAGAAVASAAETSTPKVEFGPMALATGPAPFRGTTEPSIAEAEAALGVHIPRPHTAEANDRTAWSVVVDRRNQWVAITYGQAPGSGVSFLPQV